MNKEKLEQKIGEAIGLEMAAQKAVEELSSKGLLSDEIEAKSKLEDMRKEANNHQMQMEDLVKKLSQSDGIDSSKIHEVAQETEQKATKMMETYLGEDPDSQEALEFLCLAEGGEVTHYEHSPIRTISALWLYASLWPNLLKASHKCKKPRGPLSLNHPV